MNLIDRSIIIKAFKELLGPVKKVSKCKIVIFFKIFESKSCSISNQNSFMASTVAKRFFVQTFKVRQNRSKIGTMHIGFNYSFDIGVVIIFHVPRTLKRTMLAIFMFSTE